jgi:DNA-binding HxlR family transcriptional regulator
MKSIKRFECPVYGIQRIVSGKYKLRILWDLQDGRRRYGQIRRKLLTGIPGTKTVTPRVLSSELKSLIQMGLLERTEHQVLPRKVESELTPLGKSLVPVIAVMHKWGVRHLVRDSVLRKLGLSTEGGT